MILTFLMLSSCFVFLRKKGKINKIDLYLMYQSYVHSNMTDMQYEITVSERKIKQRKDVKRQREKQTHTKKFKKNERKESITFMVRFYGLILVIFYLGNVLHDIMSTSTENRFILIEIYNEFPIQLVNDKKKITMLQNVYQHFIKSIFKYYFLKKGFLSSSFLFFQLHTHFL